MNNALNTKADVDLTNASGKSGLRRLVEVYNNGTSWYKVFQEYDKSTGNLIGNWCEQGGRTSTISNGGTLTTTFLKPFSSKNYTLTHAIVSTIGGSANDRVTVFETTYFTAYSGSGGATWSWMACGYIS